MVNAMELINQQKQREDRKYITYDKIYNMIEKKINIASASNNYYTWYQIPEFLIGMPKYSLDECNSYIQNKLNKDGFKTIYYDPNILLIKWFPNT
jgi:hypothetical protein